MIFWCQSCGEQHTQPHVTSANITTCATCGGSSFATWKPRHPLSQEAVRDEALELRRLVKLLADLAVTESEIEQEFMHGPRVIFEKGGQIAVRDVLMARKTLKRKPARAEWQCNRCPSPGGCALVEECALKREPNAAGQVDNAGTRLDTECISEPAPAAPDAASMVKRINAQFEECCAVGGHWDRMRDVARDAAALLAKLGQGWIPVSERLPEGDEDVLAASEKRLHVKPSVIIRNAMAAAKREGDVGFYTHWMPLPQLPGASDE